MAAHQQQIRRGTSAQIAAFTPALGEVIYNTTTKTLHLGDGATLGGNPILTAAEVEDLIEAGGSGGYNVQIYTADDTWPKPAGLVRTRVTVVGPGGAGGGAVASAGPNNAKGAGGGAGGAAVKFIEEADLGSTEAVDVGVGGTGTTGTGNAGTGNSSFGSHCSATPGLGGAGEVNTDGVGGAPGGYPGVGVGGTYNQHGEEGRNSTGSESGRGGDSLTGAGGEKRSSSGTGNAGSQGAGGGGACATAGLATISGGAGGNGFVMVEEFF